MDIEDKYSIDYAPLPDGRHRFSFRVDDALFKAMESNEIKGGDCIADVELDRSESGLGVHVSINGTVTVECDRCLEDCSIPVDFDGELSVRFSDTVSDYDGERMWIAKGQKLPLAQYIYESIVISLPYRRVHPEGGCNPEMMARFTPAEELPETE